MRQLRHAAHELVEHLRLPQHLVGVALNARPASFAHTVEHLDGAVAAGNQVAALDDEVGSNLLEVRNHRFQRGEIAVNVGNDGEAHEKNLDQPSAVSHQPSTVAEASTTLPSNR